MNLYIQPNQKNSQEGYHENKNKNECKNNLNNTCFKLLL